MFDVAGDDGFCFMGGAVFAAEIFVACAKIVGIFLVLRVSR